MALWRIERTLNVPTLQIAGAYTALDVVGGRLALSLGGGYSGGGYIHSVMLLDHDNEKAAMTLYFWSEIPTAIADADNFAPTEAEAKYQIGSISLPAANYTSFNTTGYALGRASGKDAMSNEYIAWEYAPSGSIYCFLVCTATPTYTAATDLELRVLMFLS
jgi:hypothetical protein